MKERERLGHPDSTELLRYVLGDVEARAARHVRGCDECNEIVRRLRANKTALHSLAVPPHETSADCLDEHLIAAFADGSMTPAQRRDCLPHLAGCGRCRTAVSSVARAIASDEVAGQAATGRGRGPALEWLRYAVPFAAAAAIATLFFIRQPSPPVIAPHRQDPEMAGLAPVAISPLGPTTTVRVLRWHSVPGADRYRITLFDDQGDVIFETSLADTLAALPTGVEIVAGRPHYWIVSARTGFDRWDTSALAEFSTVGDTTR
jgi:anti-sigma factor RsiW